MFFISKKLFIKNHIFDMKNICLVLFLLTVCKDTTDTTQAV
jgi:hypothetical protein